MKLLTKELEKKFKKHGRQEDKKDPVVITKFFKTKVAPTFQKGLI